LPDQGSEGRRAGVNRTQSAASWPQIRTVEKLSAIFQTVSEGLFSELRVDGVLRSSSFQKVRGQPTGSRIRSALVIVVSWCRMQEAREIRESASKVLDRYLPSL
jgi:hypothetical protein